MRPILLLLLFAVPLSSSAQAVRSPPSTGPLIIQQPPSYPTPTYTPPGTGLPATGQPGAQPASAPRSPNKRILPATKGPGVWAADDGHGASAVLPPKVFGVDMPNPVSGNVVERAVMDTCRHALSMASKESQQEQYLLTLPTDIRMCLAAKAHSMCSTLTLNLFQGSNQKAQFPPGMEKALLAAQQHAFSLEATYCSGVTIDQDAHDAHRKVMKQWMKTATAPTPSGDKH